MAKEMLFTEEEKKNQVEMLLGTLNSLVKEKLEHPKWNEKIKNVSFNINLIIPDAGSVYLKLEKEGKYDIGKGKIDDPIIEITASLERFFNFSSRQMSSFSAVFLGKLKIKGKRHFLTLLNVGNVLRIIPEKDLKE